MPTRSDGTDTLHAAKVGDSVACYIEGNLTVLEVSSVEGNRVTLSDGSEWRTRGGLRWGHGRLTRGRDHARLVVDMVTFNLANEWRWH